MIAMALGLFLVAVIVNILMDNKQSFVATKKLSRLQENGRVAIQMISGDLKRAGYMGGNSDRENIVGTAGQVLPVDLSCATGDTTWGRMIELPTSGLNDDNTGYSCIPDSDYVRGDILTVRYASPWLSTAFADDSLYLRSSIFEGKIFAGSDEDNTDNGVIDEPQSVHDLIAYAYYIGDSGRSCNGAAVPSLFREVLSSEGRPVAQEIIPGIEHFQVQYGLNGRYLNADDLVLTDWADVITVRLWFLARSECAENGYADSKIYKLGDVEYEPADAFRRQLYSSVVMLRN